MPDGGWGSTEPSPLERLVAAREAEKKVQRKKDTRVLASLAVVAVVLVGGGVFTWLRLIPGAAPSRHHPRTVAATRPAATTTARSAPTVSVPGLTSPVDANEPPRDPFSGTPAEHWANSAAGITIPAARARGPYTATQVRSAYETTRELLIAGNLDWPTLRGGAPKAFEKLLIKSELKAFLAGLHSTKVDKNGADENSRGWITTFAPGSAKFVTTWYDVTGSAAGAQCGTKDGYIHPNYPSGPPSTVQATGKPVDPYSLATPDPNAGCQNTTGT
jgi:hypothetical protein